MPKFHALTIREVRQEADDAVRLTLDVPAELAEAFRGKPGQHVVLRLRLGTEELRRTYSITGAAGSLPLTLGIRIQSGGRCSTHLASALRTGDVLELMPPYGRFGSIIERLPATAAPRRYIAFAAGSGITPVLSIIRTVLATQPSALVTLFYGNRNSRRTMFLEDLLALKNQYLARLALHFFMTAEPSEVELFNGRLDGRKVRELAGRTFDPRVAAQYFICGPGDMVEEVRAALRSLHVPDEQVHSERFVVPLPQAASAGASPATAVPVAEAAEPTIQVALVMDGRHRSFTLRRADTVLEGAERAGIALPYSCRAGVCSTCRVRLRAGRVVMAQNSALEPWELEQGFVLACQARALTETLELDYDAK
jgi:ring-1,2-phenylacetyl-CoA epoxidase subunit PaaE